MVERNGILVAEDIAQIGDTLKIEGRASDGSTLIWKRCCRHIQ